MPKRWQLEQGRKRFAFEEKNPRILTQSSKPAHSYEQDKELYIHSVDES